MVRDSFYDKIADKLKCETLSSEDWWSTLKTVIAPNSKSTIPPLTYNDNIYSDERDKANILNDYFQSQTLLDDQNAVLPKLPPLSLKPSHPILFSLLLKSNLFSKRQQSAKRLVIMNLVIVYFENYHANFPLHSVHFLIIL